MWWSWRCAPTAPRPSPASGPAARCWRVAPPPETGSGGSCRWPGGATWSTRRGCGRWERGGSTRSSWPPASPSSGAFSISVASTTAAISPSRDARCARPRQSTPWSPTAWSRTSGSTRRSACLPGPAVGVAGGDFRRHPGERVVQVDMLRVGDADPDEQDVGELHGQGALGFLLLLGLLTEPVVDLLGLLAYLLL